MRRRSPDALVPNEERTLLAALALQRLGFDHFHGYKLASQLRSMHHTTRAMSYSTLYRCLDRLESRGLVTSSWAEESTASSGPRRRVFQLSEDGQNLADSLAGRSGPNSELFWNLA